MTESDENKELHASIPDGDGYVYWYATSQTVCLDGEFNADELRAILAFMDRKKAEALGG